MYNIATRQNCQVRHVHSYRGDRKMTKKDCVICREKRKSKAVVQRTPKIKKVIESIRTMCGNKTDSENDKEELMKKESNQSIIYVGTYYSKQAYSTVDLTKSNTSLETVSRFNSSHEIDGCHNKHSEIRTYQENVLKPNICKSMSSESVLVTRRHVMTSGMCPSSRSVLLNQSGGMQTTIEALNLDITKKVCPVPKMSSEQISNLVLDMEGDYFCNDKFDFEPVNFLHTNGDLEEIINIYLPHDAAYEM